MIDALWGFVAFAMGVFGLYLVSGFAEDGRK